MKAKNLFLACLATAAMTACSNENDNILDSNEGVKNAKMQISIELPKATGTRAADDKDGITAENTVKNVFVVVSNTNGTVSKYFDTNIIETTAFTTKEFEVPSGANSTVTVYANYGNITAAPTADETTAGATSTGGGFHMNGTTSDVNIVAGTQNTKVTVAISRIAAKIVERTAKTEHTASANGKDMTFTIQKFALVNLSNKAGVWAETASESMTTDDYTQYYGGENAEAADLFKDFTTAKEMDATEPGTYCLGNISESIKTQVAYKVKVTYEGAAEDGTFYVRTGDDKTAYTLSELQEAYPNIYNAMTGDESIKECLALGLYKYVGGICYYKQDIKTTATTKAEILRNNLYKLNVTSFSKLGTPEIDTPEPNDPTALTIAVTVQEWTVNSNDIEF